jgi:hypothetical protein
MVQAPAVEAKVLPIEFLSGATSEYLRKEFIKNGGHEHAENELILAKPLECLWVGGDGD